MVLFVDQERFFALEQSIFYPQGGGQPADLGTVQKNSEPFRVLNAKKNGENVVIEVDKPGIVAGDTLQCELDWNRRYALMRMHTSVHLLAKVIFNQTGSLITGNQLDATVSRMDFNVSEFNREIAESYIQKVNEIVSRGLPVTAEFLPRETALQRPELVRLKDIMPPNLQSWRIVSIGDFDVQADGGTHVANTREIGKMVLDKTENKGKENRRIYWKLESR